MSEELLSPEPTPVPTLSPIIAPLMPVQAAQEAHWYAQLDAADTCVGISMLSGPVESAALISISGEDHSLLGQAYDRAVGTFVPPEPTTAPVDPCEWLIDIGAFYDRFGSAWLAVMMSTSPVVKAFLANIVGRNWVDLKRPDLPSLIQYMRGVNVPGIGKISTPIAGVTEALEIAILTTPVAPAENIILRKLIFS